MTRLRQYQVKEVSAISGVSVRALHHYDEIGLLVPSARSEAGYRLYGDSDLLRLQHILVSRALGLSLEQIRRSLDDPHFDRKQSLLAQRTELERRAKETADMLRSVDRALAAFDMSEDDNGGDLDMKEIFEGFDSERYAPEVDMRWGQTDSYRESKRRTERYTKEDWATFRAEQAAIYRDLFDALQAAESPEGELARKLAERARLLIDRWFYPCNKAMHAQLADMYEADERFQQSIDQFGGGLTTFLAAAIRANARSNEA